MPTRLRILSLLLPTLALTAAGTLPAAARELVVGPDASLRAVIASAEPGDRLRILAGRHAGPVTITVPLSLSGEPGAGIDGGGAGTVITIEADDVTVEGLGVTGSGSSHEDLDAGIKVVQGARNARVLNNRIEGNLYGVDVHGGRDALVRGNTIVGRRDHRMNSRGNGIYVWNAPGTVVAGNDIRYGRDGIFVNTSRDNRFVDNSFRDLRFAVHYMYTNASELAGNRSTGNHAGYALMFSRDLVVRGNSSERDRDHGIMLNYVNGAEIEGNTVRDGGGKCLFMYNANKNRIVANRFEGCEIGVHFTAGSERNVVARNAFIGNRTQVKYVGTRWLEWSEGGTGNYWSDHTAFDLDKDGTADMAYRPNDLMDHVLWTQPSARLLLGSPAVQLIRWVLSSFPSLLPGGVVDSSPLMRPAATAEAAR